MTARDAAGNTTRLGAVLGDRHLAERDRSALDFRGLADEHRPAVTWQPPVTFAVTAWKIYRDGTPLPTILSDAAVLSFDDSGLAAQGPHTYAVQA